MSATPAASASAINFFEAPAHCLSSARQASIDFASARILASTPRHFSQTNPSGARKVNRPNGSSLVDRRQPTAVAGASLATPMPARRSGRIGRSDLHRAGLCAGRLRSCLASTALMVKKRTWGGVAAENDIGVCAGDPWSGSGAGFLTRDFAHAPPHPAAVNETASINPSARGNARACSIRNMTDAPFVRGIGRRQLRRSCPGSCGTRDRSGAASARLRRVNTGGNVENGPNRRASAFDRILSKLRWAIKLQECIYPDPPREMRCT